MASRTTFLNVDDTKAGMEDVDKDRINRLIQEASKSKRICPPLMIGEVSDLDSKFFKQQQRREEVSQLTFSLIGFKDSSRKIVDEST